jgi:hypothetical protein
MNNRCFKVILIPDPNGKVRELRIPIFLSALVLFLLAVSAVALAWIVADYAMMKVKTPVIAQLEEENERQKLDLIHMSQNVISVVHELNELRAIDSEEEVLHNLARNFNEIQGGPKNDDDRFLLIGQADSGRYASLAGEVRSALAFVASEIGVKAPAELPLPRKVAAVKRGQSHTPKVRTANRATVIKKLRTVAMELGLSPRLALSMAKVESGYDHKAVSPKGAIGVLQLLPRYVCQEYDITPDMLFDPDVNIRIGLAYMKYLLARFGENLDLSLAAYNAGPTRVVRAGYGIPPIEETRDYVKKVKEAMRVS